MKTSFIKAWNEAGALVKPKGILTRNGPGEFEMQSCVYHLQTPESDGNHFSNQASKISCYHVIHQAIPQDGEFLFNGDGIECSIIHAKSPGIVPFFHQQHWRGIRTHTCPDNTT